MEITKKLEMALMTSLVERIKSYVFDKENSPVCSHCEWCDNRDGYCPTYDCTALDKLKSFSDRQWQNAIEKVMTSSYRWLTQPFGELVDEVLSILKYKKPSNTKKRR